MEKNYERRKCNSMKKGVFGFILLIAGALMLSFNLGVLPAEFKSVIFSWQMLLIAIGLINISSKDSFILGVVLILVGGFFILPKFLVLPDNFISLFWPVILILAGLMILLKKWTLRHHFHVAKETNNDSGFIEETNIFGGNKTKINAPTFKGGKIVNVFGGSEINLMHTQLDEGKNLLEIVCVFGGVLLIVPADWIIKVEVASVMGGFSDKRVSIKSKTDDTRELIIKGVVVFGGGELKSFG
ncbi:MAG: DUF5668 domain-containing protein [Bacteroidales bacterium]|nr:DUF5668 domain-containing protein [Bacteroidales bacterium]